MSTTACADLERGTTEQHSAQAKWNCCVALQPYLLPQKPWDHLETLTSGSTKTCNMCRPRQFCTRTAQGPGMQNCLGALKPYPLYQKTGMARRNGLGPWGAQHMPQKSSLGSRQAHGCSEGPVRQRLNCLGRWEDHHSLQKSQLGLQTGPQTQ